MTVKFKYVYDYCLISKTTIAQTAIPYLSD